MDDDGPSDSLDPIVTLLEAFADDPIDELNDQAASDDASEDVVWMLNALASSVYDAPIRRAVDHLIDADEAITPEWRQNLIRSADSLLVERRLTQGRIQPLLRHARQTQARTPQDVAEATGLAVELVPGVETGELPITKCEASGLVTWVRFLSINAHVALQSLYLSLRRPSSVGEIAGGEELLPPTPEDQQYFDAVKALFDEG